MECNSVQPISVFGLPCIKTELPNFYAWPNLVTKPIGV